MSGARTEREARRWAVIGVLSVIAHVLATMLEG